MTPEHNRTVRQPLSRRRLLTAAAGAGVTAATIGAVGTTTAGLAYAGSHSSGAGRSATVDEPVMVHLRDLASGTVEVFRGTHRIQVTDRALAKRIAEISHR